MRFAIRAKQENGCGPHGNLVKIECEKSGRLVLVCRDVPYRPSNSPIENPHSVMDVWGKYRVPNYVSRGGITTTVEQTKEQHSPTKAVYRQL
ncbi:hypothetical protein GJU40_11905 [Bacillus lacus]|uniref:Tox-SHH domain-containing protein n=1 Tax=Metabacillus lacus TaxID=1983721 RepID=A0A7X2J080_9BACI|nr:hypothetical protein [Metabacillus lacus]MRX72849.1 hypothetical protein [Metabacillus lacus]